MMCETCKKVKPDVQWIPDPYQLEINEVEDWSWMCNQCYRNSADDI
jgi:hypothetical protein